MKHPLMNPMPKFPTTDYDPERLVQDDLDLTLNPLYRQACAKEGVKPTTETWLRWLAYRQLPEKERADMSFGEFVKNTVHIQKTDQVATFKIIKRWAEPL